jgi:hypothetical protein
MPFEYRLMAEGWDQQQQRELQERAVWMSYHLSATGGKPITAAELLGEQSTTEKAEKPDIQALKAAEKRYRRIQKQIRKQKG